VNDLATAVWEGQTGTCAPAQPLSLLRRFISRNPDTLSIKQFVEPASSHPMRRPKTSNPQSDASRALGRRMSVALRFAANCASSASRGNVIAGSASGQRVAKSGDAAFDADQSSDTW
jgi:hypothetical protein